MNTTILKTTLAAGLGVAAAATLMAAAPAAARTEAYTFANTDGSPYCDGITLTTHDKITYHGVRTGSCVTPVKADGLVYHLATAPSIDLPSLWSPKELVTFLLDIKNSGWQAWEDRYGVNSLVNAGRLLDGAPPSHPKGRLAQASIGASIEAASAQAPGAPYSGGAGPDDGKTQKFTFADVNGAPYCDGVTIVGTFAHNYTTPYTGIHTGACEKGETADGLRFQQVRGYPPVIAIATTSAPAPEVVDHFVLNLHAATWQLWESVGSKLVEVNSGVLLKGEPAAAKTPGPFRRAAMP